MDRKKKKIRTKCSKKKKKESKDGHSGNKKKIIETLDQDSWKTEQWVVAWGADKENRAEGKDSCREAQQGTKKEKTS